MSHTFKVKFVWPDIYGDAMAECPGCNEEDTASLARQLLDQRIHEKFPNFPDLKYDIRFRDDHHVYITIVNDKQAMLFKLAHGGEQ